MVLVLFRIFALRPFDPYFFAATLAKHWETMERNASDTEPTMNNADGAPRASSAAVSSQAASPADEEGKVRSSSRRGGSAAGSPALDPLFAPNDVDERPVDSWPRLHDGSSAGVQMSPARSSVSATTALTAAALDADDRDAGEGKSAQADARNGEMKRRRAHEPLAELREPLLSAAFATPPSEQDAAAAAVAVHAVSSSPDASSPAGTTCSSEIRWRVGRLWSPGDSLPPLPPCDVGACYRVLQQRRRDDDNEPLLVVENPPMIDGSGKAHRRVSLGVPLQRARGPHPLEAFLRRVRTGEIVFTPNDCD
jgi:hypothetical protein